MVGSFISHALSPRQQLVHNRLHYIRTPRQSRERGLGVVTRTGTTNSNHQLQTTFTSPCLCRCRPPTTLQIWGSANGGITANKRSTSLSRRFSDYRSALADSLSVCLERDNRDHFARNRSLLIVIDPYKEERNLYNHLTVVIVVHL